MSGVVLGMLLLCCCFGMLRCCCGGGGAADGSKRPNAAAAAAGMNGHYATPANAPLLAAAGQQEVDLARTPVHSSRAACTAAYLEAAASRRQLTESQYGPAYNRFMLGPVGGGGGGGLAASTSATVAGTTPALVPAPLETHSRDGQRSLAGPTETGGWQVLTYLDVGEVLLHEESSANGRDRTKLQVQEVTFQGWKALTRCATMGAWQGAVQRLLTEAQREGRVSEV